MRWKALQFNFQKIMFPMEKIFMIDNFIYSKIRSRSVYFMKFNLDLNHMQVPNNRFIPPSVD